MTRWARAAPHTRNSMNPETLGLARPKCCGEEGDPTSAASASPAALDGVHRLREGLVTDTRHHSMMVEVPEYTKPPPGQGAPSHP